MFGSDRLPKLLCLPFNAMLQHGDLCHDQMLTFIVPVLIDKKGDISSEDNYWPRAITSVI